MIITSTNDIKGYKITHYLGLINVNLVIGVNFLSDFLASLSDFFGGYSSTYQSKLDEVYGAALRELAKKAEFQRADAIVGIHFDFDELSGQGKAMFMITAYGTAVKAEPVTEIIEKTDRYEIYQKLYNLSIFKEKGIITDEQYVTEKNNLLLSNEEIIEKEIKNVKADNARLEAVKQAEILSKQRELERQRQLKEEIESQIAEKKTYMTDSEIEVELRKLKKSEILAAYETFQTNVATIIVKVHKLLESNLKSPKDVLDKLALNDVMEASYDDVDLTDSNKAAHSIGILLKYGRIAEACKYYIDLVGDDNIVEAKSYVNSIYDMLSFKNQSDFEKIARNLIELKCIGKTDKAVVEFSNYAICDFDIARQVVELL